MQRLKTSFIALFISTINLTLASHNQPNYHQATIQKQVPSIKISSIDNNKLFGHFVLSATAILMFHKLVAKKKTSNEPNIHQAQLSKPHQNLTVTHNHHSSSESSEQTSFEESEHEDNNSHENHHNVTWSDYDGNREGFKMLIELFPEVALIQKINYEKALPSPLMENLLVTVRFKNKHYLNMVHSGYIINFWLRKYGILHTWPKDLTFLITDKIVVQKNPKLVYHNPNFVLLAQDGARFEKISVEIKKRATKRSEKYKVYGNNDYLLGNYPVLEQNIVLISEAKYTHESDKRYVHVNYCTLWPDKAYEYDQGSEDRDRVIYTDDRARN